MKKTIILLALVALTFVSCNNQKKAPEKTQPQDRAKIIAIFTDSLGNKVPLVALRVIERGAIYDSVLQDWKVLVDTSWAIEKNFPLTDSLGKPKIDSLGKPVYGPFWVLVPKKSINTHVENISVDSLVKKSQ